ncbi:MAG: ATP-dependent RecD-like DNA helicase [Sandaracinus sp.]|nr:ATP-dependent RecD-like DNA helicase [Sandaracinus sp.]MCB9636321.1 ATP-dependent RecD-like DNA helicase [Sandaracinus sp.]
MRAPETTLPGLRDEVLDGTVEEVTFRSSDGRFAVVRMSRRNEAFVAIGDFGELATGESLRLHGRWSKHAVHGDRFRVSSFTPIVPTTRAGIVRYLGSGLVPGIGKALAERLVARFGEHTLEVITQEASRLQEVEGIGRRRALAISEAVRSRRDEADRLAFLHGLGLGPALSRKILQRYGEGVARVLREDPYLVAEQIPGVGFKIADRVGLAVGIGRDDPRRAQGAVLHLLAKAADDGHVFVEREDLARSAERLDVPLSRAHEAVDALAERGLIVLEEDACYPPPLHAAERLVAEVLARLARPRRPERRSDEVLRRATEGLAMSDEQRAAVRAAIDEGLLVLTGGPGTGKTTTVRALVQAQLLLGRKVLLAAPTGRAAKRLTEATGQEARTIHRLLEWNPATGRFQRDASSPLEADLVLVDEASMLNVQLAASLVDAIAASSRLVLVGDVDQLPPVGPGQVLREVLTSEVGRTVRLTQVFRQAHESAIVRGAHAVLRGEVPEASPPGEPGEGDLFVVRARQTDRILALVEQLQSRIVKTYGLDPKRDVMVLAPTRKGPLGTQTLNERLQRALNPMADPSRLGMLFPGDKVMQLSNDYDRDVYNGDLGTVTRVEGGMTFVDVEGRELQYRIDDLDALTLAYASTVHKVQGSELPAVVIVLHGSHHVLLSRALLYTALTRAKRLAVLVGDPVAIARAATNAVAYESNSRLAWRLANAASRAEA